MITFQPFLKLNKQSALFLFNKGEILNKISSPKTSELYKRIEEAVKSKQFNAESMEAFPLLVNQKVVLLVGLGDKKEQTLTKLRIIVKRAISAPSLSKIRDVEILPQDDKDENIVAILEGIKLGGYVWKKYKTKDKKSKVVDIKNFFIVASKKSVYSDCIKVCEGVNFSRDLVNNNADVVTSTYLEATIKKLIKGKKLAQLKVLNGKELKKQGLNLHLAVNQGSNKEPKLIIVKYQGGNLKDKYTAIIGKGITFDSGGLNLKPSGHMETMKTDMSGAATVIGVLKNTIDLNIKKNLLFVCGVAENAIGKGAYKPGDVFKSYSGKTIEIGNTDAEGRLVLADAIAYIEKNYKPYQMIDIATLTGACVVALGYDYTGLMSSEDDLANNLLKSAEATDDRAWRLPLYPELKGVMKSQIADLKNTSNQRGAAGTVTAAEFLKEFTNNARWAHLDIAGTSYVETGERMYFSYGATGSGIRLLTHFLRN